MSDIQALAATLRDVAKPDMTRKALTAAVRRMYPNATKKEIVRAAFYALTQGSDGDPEKARHLHAFALAERAGDEEDAPPPRKARGKDQRKKDQRKERAAQPSAP